MPALEAAGGPSQTSALLHAGLIAAPAVPAAARRSSVSRCATRARRHRPQTESWVGALVDAPRIGALLAQAAARVGAEGAHGLEAPVAQRVAVRGRETGRLDGGADAHDDGSAP